MVCPIKLLDDNGCHGFPPSYGKNVTSAVASFDILSSDIDYRGPKG